MITGNHDGANACLTTTNHSLLGLFTGRIDHADQAKEDQVSLHILGSRHLWMLAIGQAEDAHRATRHLGIRLHDLATAFVGEWFHLAVSPLSDASRKDHFRSSLGVHDSPAISSLEDDRHRLPLRVERNLEQDVLFIVMSFDARFECGDDQRPFGRIANDLPGVRVVATRADRGIVTTRRCRQSLHEVRIVARIDRITRS